MSRRFPNKYDRQAKVSAARFVQCPECPLASGHAAVWQVSKDGTRKRLVVPTHDRVSAKAE